MTKSERKEDDSSSEQITKRSKVDGGGNLPSRTDEKTSTSGDESSKPIKEEEDEVVGKDDEPPSKPNEPTPPTVTKGDVKEEKDDNHTAKTSKEENVVVKYDDDDGEPPAIKVNDPKRAAIETPVNPIRNPHPNDVLLGRGKPFQNHSGNQQMLTIVDVYRAKYHESERAYKHSIIEEVLGRIKSCGGRFLERIDDFENSYWNEVSHSIAYRKVGHAFRSTARRQEVDKDKQKHKGTAPPMNQNLPMGHPGMSMMGVGMDYNGFGGPMMSGMRPVAMGMMGMHPTMMSGFGGPMVAGMGAPPMGPGRFAGMGFPPSGGGFNHTQRALLEQEKMLHANRIEAIMQASASKGSNPMGGGRIPGNGDPSPAGTSVMMQAGGSGVMNHFGPRTGGGGFRIDNVDDIHESMMYNMESATGSNRRPFMVPGPGGSNSPATKK